MVFPKSRMRFATSYEGKIEPNGWIVLDLTGVDLDGVNKIALSAADLDAIKHGGDVAADRVKRARSLLGGESGRD